MAQTSAEYTWVPPSYDVSSSPLLGGTVRLAPDPFFSNNFVRSAKWRVFPELLPDMRDEGPPPILLLLADSGLLRINLTYVLFLLNRCPDGSMALAHCENRSFQMLNL